MSIEEAENILNEAVITEPSISSYTYISADEINEAINKILEQKNKLEKIIIEKEINVERYPVQTKTNKRINIKKIIKYLRNAVPTFLEVRS